MPDTDKIIVAPLCNSSVTCYIHALATLMASITLLENFCPDCGEQCLRTDFIVKNSFLDMTIEWQLDGIKQFVENSNISLPTNWSATWRQHISENYLILNVIVETTTTERYTQVAAVNLVDVVSSIGGQTGLWAGISFLSIMELIELIYRLRPYQCHIIRKNV